MKGKGSYHERVPRAALENLAYRRRVLLAARDDLRLQKGLREACRRDVLFFINTFVWQFNPTKEPAHRVEPFITWDFQERALLAEPAEWDGNPLNTERGILWCYFNNHPCVVEKSREMGASWLFLIFECWLGLFEKWCQLMNISKDLDSVDDGTTNSLFWKLRFIHEHLPDWLKGEIVEQMGYCEYKRTRSTNVGEAPTSTAGVGGRSSVMFIDEFSKIKADKEVRRRTASTGDARFFNGTHQGLHTEFFALTQTPEIVKIVMHWSQHPDKIPGAYRFNEETNRVEVLDKQYQYPEDFRFVMESKPVGGPYPGLRSPWYDKKCRFIGDDRAVAEELDINPSGSVAQFFDPVRIKRLQDACIVPKWEGDVVVGPDGRVLDWEKRKGGPLKLWIHIPPDGRAPPDKFGVGADVSAGTGRTPSCLSIANERGEKVGQYTDGHVIAEKFADIAVALAWWFNSAALGWEGYGPGANFGKRVIELGYQNCLMHRDETRKYNGKARLNFEKPGWYPNPEKKGILMREYRAALYGGDFTNWSFEALEECLAFRYNPKGFVEHGGEVAASDPTAAGYNHGDHVIADALCYRMVKGNYQQRTLKPQDIVPVMSLAWRRQLAEQAEKGDEARMWL